MRNSEILLFSFHHIGLLQFIHDLPTSSNCSQNGTCALLIKSLYDTNVHGFTISTRDKLRVRFVRLVVFYEIKELKR